jgi:succinyl-diaminopimelate desuccinylase
VAGNVLPDVCEIEVNYRFAPDRSEAAAREHLAEIFEGYAFSVSDSAPGALPGLEAPAVREFLRVLGTEPVGKFGWTDVSRFAGLGIPALTPGPGDSSLAHKQDERVEVSKIVAGVTQLRRWLTA